MSDDPTRPVSVAELLARNGTIGSPPVSGHRRRKRRNAVSVAELTGELPVIRTGEIPVFDDDEPADEALDETASSRPDEPMIVYSSSGDAAVQIVTRAESGGAGAVAETPDYSDTADYTPEYTAPPKAAVVEEPVGGDAVAAQVPEVRQEDRGEVETPAAAPVKAGKSIHLRSSIPRPIRRRGPERSHDPRPRRRSAGAEQMAYDPVDEAAVDLAELVADQAPDSEELRSYLHSASGTLFSGETVADDLARRGLISESGEGAGLYDGEAYDDEDYEDYDDESADADNAPRRGPLRTLGSSLVATLQSLFAVVFGAGLFIAFDQLWRWNNIVALALSTLVIVALVIGVHVVRKTEDFVSIIIAVAVGILVTFGPLALQST